MNKLNLDGIPVDKMSDTVSEATKSVNAFKEAMEKAQAAILAYWRSKHNLKLKNVFQLKKLARRSLRRCPGFLQDINNELFYRRSHKFVAKDSMDIRHTADNSDGSTNTNALSLNVA